MMKVIVAYGREPEINCKQLIEAFSKAGAEVIPASIADLSAFFGGGGERFFVRNDEITGADACVVRSLGRGRHESLTRRFSLLAHMQKSGTLVVNPPEAFQLCRDKYRSLIALQGEGVRVPRTIVTENALVAHVFSKRFKRFICKPLIGSMGFGSVAYEDHDLAYNEFRLLERLGLPIYVQEFIENPGRDTRVLVLGDKPLSAYHRVAPPSSWKTNVARGGKVEIGQVGAEIVALALKATKIMGLYYAGVDIIESEKGPYIIEVNASPSWQGAQRVTDKNIPEAIAHYIINIARK
jgi:RimK family alpha-L-glutamate ligase